MSIIVRPFTEEDRPAIQAMHSGMKLDYEQPDWNHWKPVPKWRTEGKALFKNNACVGLADTHEISREIATTMNGAAPISAIVEVDGAPAMGVFLRRTAETFLLMDSAQRKREHLANLLIMHRELVFPMKRAGLTDTHAWIPPSVEEEFGKLLLNLRWKKQMWNSYCYEVK